ncbi:MAG: hypothetical protein QM778_28570 [Myxococcales bacterium]
MAPERGLDIWSSRVWQRIPAPEIIGVCKSEVPGDQGLPAFEGTLTVPLDIVVPGGLTAAMKRIERETALDREQGPSLGPVIQAASDKRVELDAIRLRLDAGDADAAVLFARLSAEQEKLDRALEAANRAFEARMMEITDAWNREREPIPALDDKSDAGTDAGR